MASIPEGNLRYAALQRIEILTCSNPDRYWGSCNRAAKPPPLVVILQKQFSKASVDDTAYTKALATELRGLVCTSDASAIHILRRISGSEGRLAETGHEAPALVDFIMSKACPVSASLTGDDKATLLKIKQDAEQISGPPTASKKEQ
jgi:hypothetical protein